MKMNKKAMETWQLVLIVLAVIFLLAVIIFYGGLGSTIEDLFGKVGDLF